MGLSLFFDSNLVWIDGMFYGSILTIIVCIAYLKMRGATLHAIKQNILMGTATVLLVVGIVGLGYSIGYADTITRVEDDVATIDGLLLQCWDTIGLYKEKYGHIE